MGPLVIDLAVLDGTVAFLDDLDGRLEVAAADAALLAEIDVGQAAG